jgi:two-component system, OmpR family, sensor histidine kinase VicK
MISLKILIVDDDAALCKSLRSFFERQHYVVEIANTVPRAFELLTHFQPDILFLDVRLPERSGIGVLAEVKEKYPAVRVIVITGESDSEYERKARVLGADDFIVKPFTLEYLQKEVMEKVHRKAVRELKATFHELGIEREKMQLLFDQIREGVMLVDPQGLLVIANHAARNILGLPRDISGLTLEGALKAFTVEALPVPRGQMGQPLKGNPLTMLAQQVGEPFDLVRQDPAGLILECRINPLRTSAKMIEGSVVIFHDVTDQRRTLGAMKRLISVLMHKFRTPLMSMIGYPRLLLNSTFGDAAVFNEAQKKALESILTNSLRLDETINQLIGYTCLDPSELESKPVVLNELVHSAIDKLSQSARNYSDKTVLDEGLQTLSIRVDPLRARLAFENLMENAFKFGASHLKIDAKKESGDAVIIRFADDGPGIPPADRERIFEEFYQVDPHFTGQNAGTGLGLSVVRDIVVAHGGKIWVESALGKGSTFYVRLPAA